jgi:CHAT domain-containing protein
LIQWPGKSLKFGCKGDAPVRFSVARTLLLATCLQAFAWCQDKPEALGDRAFEAHQYPQAVEYYRQAMEGVEDQGLLGELERKLGRSFREAGQNEQAADWYEKAQATMQRGGNNIGQARCLLSLALALSDLKQGEQAVARMLQSLEIFQNEKDLQAQAEALEDLGVIYERFERTEEALETDQRALALVRQLEQPEDEAQILVNMGVAAQRGKRFEQAFESYQAAVALYHRLKRPSLEVTTLCWLGLVAGDLGRNQQAQELLQQALTTVRQLKDPPQEASVLHATGGFHYRQKRYAEARKFYQQSLELRLAASNRAELLKTVQMLAKVCSKTEEHNQSIAYSKQALELTRELKDRQAEGSALFDLAEECFQAHLDDQAQSSYESSLAIARELKVPFLEANALRRLGDVHLEGGRLELARTHYELALAIRSPNDADLRRATLVSASKCYFRLKQSERRIAVLEEALGLARQQKNHEAEGECLALLSSGYRSLGRDGEARNAAEQSLAIAREFGQKVQIPDRLKVLGLVHSEFNRHTEALSCFQAALQLSLELQDPPVTADLQELLAQQEFALGREAEGTQAYLSALEVRRSQQDTRGQANTLGYLTSDLMKQKAYQESLNYLWREQKLEHQLQLHEREADTFSDIGFCWEKLNRPKEALRWYGVAVRLRSARRLDRENQRWTLARLANMYEVLRQPQQARQVYTSILNLSRQEGNLKDQAFALGRIASLDEDLHRMVPAEENYARSLSLYEQAADLTGQSWALYRLALLHATKEPQRGYLELQAAVRMARQAQNDHVAICCLLHLTRLGDELGKPAQETAPFLDEAEQLAKSSERTRDLAVIRNHRSFNDDLRGDWSAAMRESQSARGLADQLQDPGLEASALNKMAIIHKRVHQFGQARLEYRQALQLYRAAGDQEGEGAALHNLAEIEYELGHYLEAQHLFQQALKSHQKAGNQTFVGNSLDALGNTYLKLHQLGVAEKFYRQSLNVRKRVGNSQRIAESFESLGRLAKQRAQLAQASDFYRQSLELSEDPELQFTVLADLMELHRARNPRLAVFFGKLCINVLQRTRQNLAGSEDSSMQRSFLSGHRHQYRLLADLLMQQSRLAEAQQVLSLLKSDELKEFTRGPAGDQNLAMTAEEAQIHQRYEEVSGRLVSLAAEKEELEKAADRKGVTARLLAIEKEYQATRAEFELFLKKISREFQSQSSGQTAANLRAMSGMQEEMANWGPGVVLIYTVVGPKTFRELLVTPDFCKTYEVSTGEKAINQLVLKYREGLQAPSVDPRPASQALYSVLFPAQLQRDLKELKAKTLMWSLDGTLRYAPLNALWDGEHFLVEQYENSIFTLATQAALARPPNPDWRVAALGVSKAWGDFPALPGVPQELTAVTQTLPGKIELDQAFTESSLPQAVIEKTPVIHIASHFCLRPGDDSRSFLLLGDGNKMPVSQIRTLSFKGVDLLTLSACDTANGSSGQGSEIESFAAVAQQNNARAVLATLWPVSDQTTPILMAEFYKRRASGMTKIQALQSTQKAFLRGEIGKSSDGDSQRGLRQIRDAYGKGWTHPFYWAPFVLIGNWR